MKNTLELNQRLTTRLSQQQLRFVKILEMNERELEEAVERELEENPALETSEESRENQPAESGEQSPAPGFHNPSFYSSGRQTQDEDNAFFSPGNDTDSLATVLTRQIAEQKVDPEIASVADYIIGNLDSNGYLTRSLPQIISDLAINQDIIIDNKTAREALELVRSLEPAGIGGNNLAETLLLQLKRLPPSTERDDAIAIISDYFRDYSMRLAHKIISGLHISRERLDAANDLILTLNPKPGAAFGSANEQALAVNIPDFNITETDGELSLQFNNRIPELEIEQSFREAMRGLEHRRGRHRKGSEFVISNYNDAKDFISLMKRRRDTIMSVMTAILDFQKKYFLTGDVSALRPMTLKDIAKETGLDISVISRATTNKYVSLPDGEILPLKFFFINDVSPRNTHGRQDTETDTPSSRLIEKMITDLVDAEDSRHPLSDEKIRLELLSKGYDVSRRTIAKYRDRAGIPIARLRRRL